MSTQRRNGIDRFNVATALTDDRKFITFKRALKTDEAHAYLYLVRFFAYMAQNRAFNPQLSPDEADIVADFCYFTDEPASLIVALQIAGFLATDLTVSGWFDHQPLAELLVKKAEAGSKGGQKTSQTHQPERGTNGKFQPKATEAPPKQNDFLPKHNGQSTEANAISTEANSEPLIPNSEPLTPNANAFPSFPPTPNSFPTNQTRTEGEEGKAVKQNGQRPERFVITPPDNYETEPDDTLTKYPSMNFKEINGKFITSILPTQSKPIDKAEQQREELREWIGKFEEIMQAPNPSQLAQLSANINSCIKKDVDLFPVFADLQEFIEAGNSTSPNGLIINRLWKESSTHR